MKGFKVTDANMQCRGFQFSLEGSFKVDGEIIPCENGFHFCEQINHCFNYYDFDSNNRVFEVEALGETKTEDDKICTDKIKFIRELQWHEILKLANTGSNNTGHSNSGNKNSGNKNSGNLNSGDSNLGYSNSGNCNSGYSNSGYSNSGNRNSGDSNSGNSNSGDSNSGYSNSGNSNSGNSNSGCWNSGISNSGCWNSGILNSGCSNSGNSNSGNCNSGYSNSGNCNSGNRNSGDSNSGYRNSGAFCTENNPMLVLFDKPTNIPVKEWEKSKTLEIMSNIKLTIWVPTSSMSEKEKLDNPSYEAPEGYLKTISIKEAWANMWVNLPENKKKLFKALPNYDSEKFESITGIKY